MLPASFQVFLVVLAVELATVAFVQTIALVFVTRALVRAIRQRDLAERVSAYRQPGSSLRVNRSPLVRHRAGVR